MSQHNPVISLFVVYFYIVLNYVFLYYKPSIWHIEKKYITQVMNTFDITMNYLMLHFELFLYEFLQHNIKMLDEENIWSKYNVVHSHRRKWIFNKPQIVDTNS